jgi:hypothetical protein
MGSVHFAKNTAAMAAVIIGVAGMLSSPLSIQAQDSRIQQGEAIAPVPLNLAGKDPSLVYLGSYLVNAVGDCNGCHSSGSPTSLFLYPYLKGGNPYFNQTEKLDPSVYLNGGTYFGMVGTPTGPLMYAGPAIITRNLTPDYTGRAAGGLTLSQFLQVMTSGTDFDHVHPPCSKADLMVVNSPPSGVTTTSELEPLVHYCIPTGEIDDTGFHNKPDGDLLQIMPWVTFSHMIDKDLEAIYYYLSAIPCINNTLVPGPDGDPTELHNTCEPTPVVATANAEVKNPPIQRALRSHQFR